MVLLYYAFLTFHIFMNIVPLSTMPPPSAAVLLLHIIITTIIIIIIAIHASQISVVSSGSRCISPKEYTMGMFINGRLGRRSSSILCCKHAIILRLSSCVHPSTTIVHKHSTMMHLPLTTTLHLPPTQVRRSAA